jgi:hypothetical protein
VSSWSRRAATATGLSRWIRLVPTARSLTRPASLRIFSAWDTAGRTEKRALFEPNDGSALQRLNLLYNRSKHVKTAINAGQLAPGSTLAVWLANEGLRAVDGHLTFDEIARILEELAVWSDAIQDPLTMGEKILARYPEAAASPARPT